MHETSEELHILQPFYTFLIKFHHSKWIQTRATTTHTSTTARKNFEIKMQFWNQIGNKRCQTPKRNTASLVCTSKVTEKEKEVN